MIRAIRVRKARLGAGTCQLCRGQILVGQRIAEYANIRGWIHISCAAKTCTSCHQRMTLTAIAAGHTTHQMCKGEAE